MSKIASHAMQTTQWLTLLHRRAEVLKRLMASMGAALQDVRAAAKQFEELSPGAACCATSLTAPPQ